MAYLNDDRFLPRSLGVLACHPFETEPGAPLLNARLPRPSTMGDMIKMREALRQSRDILFIFLILIRRRINILLICKRLKRTSLRTSSSSSPMSTTATASCDVLIIFGASEEKASA